MHRKHLAFVFIFLIINFGLFPARRCQGDESQEKPKMEESRMVTRNQILKNLDAAVERVKREKTKKGSESLLDMRGRLIEIMRADVPDNRVRIRTANKTFTDVVLTEVGVDIVTVQKYGQYHPSFSSMIAISAILSIEPEEGYFPPWFD